MVGSLQAEVVADFEGSVDKFVGVPVYAATLNQLGVLRIEATTSAGSITVSVTVMRDEVHIVRVNDYWIDLVSGGGYYLFSDHIDRPGIIGAVGRLAGDADINISYMYVSRLKPRGQALMVLALDEAMPEEQLQQLLAIPDIQTVRLVRF